LTDEHAYKLKKPLATASFDHTRLEARQRACESELRLNRRLTPDVYLGVVPVSGPAPHARVEGDGPVIEYLVKMRRLPREQMLDARIAQSTVQRADVDVLATTLTDFYLKTARAGLDGPEYCARLARDSAQKCQDLAQPHYGLSHAELRAICARQNNWLTRHAELLRQRAAHVVDAHGDLRPEHICLETSPRIIDCLEFDRELRLLDPVSELSFLALECRRLGEEWIGDHLLAAYANRAGDRVPEALIRFYQIHHALIRATIAVWHLDDGALNATELWRARGRSYLRLAEDLL
jgi:aminoglycoside phosphotransferase family enzyme